MTKLEKEMYKMVVGEARRILYKTHVDYFVINNISLNILLEVNTSTLEDILEVGARLFGKPVLINTNLKDGEVQGCIIVK